MFHSRALQRWRATLLFGHLVLWAALPEAGAVEEIAAPNVDNRDWSVSNAPETWQDFVLRDEGDEEQQSAKVLFAQYFSQPVDDVADGELVRQPFFLVEDATDDQTDKKPTKEDNSQDAA